MKVIDLLNKIAKKDEVPSYIKVSIYKYEWTYDYIREEYTYMQETGERLDDVLLLTLLNTEIEVIEEPKKIEHISLEIDKFNDCYYDTALIKLAGKIDEIIDYINDRENK